MVNNQHQIAMLCIIFDTDSIVCEAFPTDQIKTLLIKNRQPDGLLIL